MARSDHRYSIYPAPRAIEVLGASSPALNQAVECWAALLARATADNSKTISKSYSDWDGKVLHEQGLHEWGLLADVLKEVRFEPEFANPGELLATAVEDCHRLENVGDKWFHLDGDYEQKDIDASVEKLVKKLRGLDYAHAWAVIHTVEWFWDHREGIDLKKDLWWSLPFRLRRSQKSPSHEGLNSSNKDKPKKKRIGSKK